MRQVSKRHLAAVLLGLGLGLAAGLWLGQRGPADAEGPLREVHVPGPAVVKEVLVEGPAEGRSPGEAPREEEEARQAALALAEENERLRERVLGLEVRVHDLNTALVAERIAADSARVRADTSALPESALPLMSRVVRTGVWNVLDRDAGTGLVALNAGKAEGLAPRMRLDVFREDEYIARLRVVEVRERLSGAVVERQVGDTLPQEGDRAVLARGT